MLAACFFIDSWREIAFISGRSGAMPHFSAREESPSYTRRFVSLAVAKPPHSAPFRASRFLLTSWKNLFQTTLETLMATFGLIEYDDASPQVRAVYEDIMATRKTDWINNFWKAIAHDPVLLKRTWESIKQIMGPGALDPLIKEMIYIAVSVTNNCNYCIASHTASAFGKGMTDAMFMELQAVIGMANETNKLVTGYQVEVDQRFLPPLPR
jgi:AhpD family alkylhydroperoxidase